MAEWNYFVHEHLCYSWYWKLSNLNLVKTCILWPCKFGVIDFNLTFTFLSWLHLNPHLLAAINKKRYLFPCLSSLYEGDSETSESHEVIFLYALFIPDCGATHAYRVEIIQKLLVWDCSLPNRRKEFLKWRDMLDLLPG